MKQKDGLQERVRLWFVANVVVVAGVFGIVLVFANAVVAAVAAAVVAAVVVAEVLPFLSLVFRSLVFMRWWAVPRIVVVAVVVAVVFGIAFVLTDAVVAAAVVATVVAAVVVLEVFAARAFVFGRWAPAARYSGDADRDPFGRCHSPKSEISLLHPRRIPKGIDSVLVLRIYFSKKRRDLLQSIDRDRKELEAEEKVFDTRLQEGITIEVTLRSADLSFDPPSFITTLTRKPLTMNITGRPTEDCKPARHPITLTITDPDTKEVLESKRFTVTVVDYAFDHVSRPLLGNVVSSLTGAASVMTFALTLLGQIDTALGLTSGTVALGMCEWIRRGVYSRYRLPRADVRTTE